MRNGLQPMRNLNISVTLQLSTLSNNKSATYVYSSHYIKSLPQIASGNKTIETWARSNLRDIQYLYSRPSLLRLHYNPVLVNKLNELMDNGALLGLGLKTLRPLFKDKHKADKYAEIVENDLLLWEINA